MAMNMDPDDKSRFDNFNVLSTTYKSVHEHDIRADVLYPKNPSPETLKTPRPVLVRFHGGGWIGADSLFPPFFAPWHLQLAERHSAVIVSANYRLIPEASIQDILDDVEDFWKWLHSSLTSFLSTETSDALKVDLDRIIVAGDSAGGHLSLHLGLSHPNELRAVLAAYPGVDTKSTAFSQPRQKPVFGLPPIPASIWTDHIEQVRAQEAKTGKKVVVSSDPRMERSPLMWTCTQHGLFGPWFAPEQRGIHILDRIEDGARFPRGGVFVWHSEQDSVVPVEGTLELKKILEEKDPELKLKVHIGEGEHGFDHQISINDEWFAEGLNEIVEQWLA